MGGPLIDEDYNEYDVDEDGDDIDGDDYEGDDYMDGGGDSGINGMGMGGDDANNEREAVNQQLSINYQEGNLDDASGQQTSASQR